MRRCQRDMAAHRIVTMQVYFGMASCEAHAQRSKQGLKTEEDRLAGQASSCQHKHDALSMRPGSSLLLHYKYTFGMVSHEYAGSRTDKVKSEDGRLAGAAWATIGLQS